MIPGIVFYPCSESDEEFKETWKKSEYWTDADFMEIYRKHRTAMEHVAQAARSYVLENWKKVTEWKDLDIIILDGSGKKTEYYNYEPPRPLKISQEPPVKGRAKDLPIEEEKIIHKTFNRLMERRKSKHNPINEVNEVILDPSDGDFSISINGRIHTWISDDNVIEIADYIEKQLKDGGDKA